MSINSVEKTMPPLIISTLSSQQPNGNAKTTVEEATEECAVYKKSTKKRNPYRQITPKIIEKIKALAPKIKKREMTHKQAAAECNIHVQTLQYKLKALSEGKNLTKKKPRQKITPELIEKIKALAPKIEKGEMTREQAAAECNIHVQTLQYKLKALSEGKNLTKRKPPQKITSELIEKMKALAPKIETGEMTREQAAAECNIHVQTLQYKLKALSEGKNLTKRKPPQKITSELIKKIKALAPKIKKREMTQEQAAAECNIHVKTLQNKLKALSEGKDLTKKRPPQKITPELIEKMKALAPKIEKGEMTREQAAVECNIHVRTLQRKLQALSDGKDLTKRKPRQEKTSVIKEQIVPMTPVKPAYAVLFLPID